MIVFLYPLLWVFGALFLCALEVVRRLFRSDPIYKYPYVSVLLKGELSGAFLSVKHVIYGIRFVMLFLLLCVLARPQWFDENSRILVEGRDIFLILDVSGSMQLFDDLKDRRTRFEVAKHEALNFIDKRFDDALGIVIFGAMAFSKCPLTQDKKLLKTVVQGIELGLVNPNGTVLSAALALAVGRLRNSLAKSKIAILLTDGAPSEQDIAPDPIIELAKKCNVRVYTIGVGGSSGGFVEMPFQGLVTCDTPRNDDLLDRIARETGGLFFRAERPEDVARVYSEIDALEKTVYEIPRYAHCVELFPFFLLGALFLLIVELAMRWWWILL